MQPNTPGVTAVAAVKIVSVCVTERCGSVLEPTLCPERIRTTHSHEREGVQFQGRCVLARGGEQQSEEPIGWCTCSYVNLVVVVVEVMMAVVVHVAWSAVDVVVRKLVGGGKSWW